MRAPEEIHGPIDTKLLSQSTQQTLESTLRTIFPEPVEETKLHRARRILKDVSTELSDEQMKVFITEAQYLIESWLDEYERNVFQGLTLQQVLKGG